MIDILFQEQDRFGRVISSKTIDDRTGRLTSRSSDPVESLKHDQACGGLCRHVPQDETYPDELHSVENGAHSSLLSRM
jgi:hypothetical protein